MIVIAHRGASAYAPENTLSSLKLAVEQGAQAVEIDVQLTKDGKLVVIHDWKVDRTTNGEGYIHELDFDYIRSLDCGSWFSDEFKGERVPTLKEVFEVIPETMMLNIEIKEIERGRSGFEKMVLDEIYEAGRLDSVIISTFHHGIIKRLHEMEPKLKLALLTSSEILNLNKYLDDNGLKSYSYHPEVNLITKDTIKELEERDIKTYVWTVNTLVDFKWLASIGVHGVITNYPDVMLEEIKKLNK